MINFKTENEPKMKFFDFGAFQKIEKMPSHDKILFHMLFGAFHDTSCNMRLIMNIKNKADMYSYGRQMLKRMKRQKVMNFVLVSQMKPFLLTRQAAEITMEIL